MLTWNTTTNFSWSEKSKKGVHLTIYRDFPRFTKTKCKHQIFIRLGYLLTLANSYNNSGLSSFFIFSFFISTKYFMKWTLFICLMIVSLSWSRSRRFDCNAASPHQAIRSIVYVSPFVARWYAVIGAFPHYYSGY